MDTHLNERQRRFADGVLQGKPVVQAYKDAGYSKRTAEANAWRLMENDGVQTYLAERREEIAEVTMVEAVEAVREWAQQAFFTFKSLLSQTIKKPEDILKLPEQTQRLIKGWKWDQHGNFVLELVDRQHALDKLSRIFGLYQADAQNWRDKEPDLLAEIFWQWVMSHHAATGKPIPALMTYADAHPEEVQAWGRETGALPPGEEVA